MVVMLGTTAKIAVAIGVGLATGTAAAALDNSIRKAWKIPDHFPGWVPLVGDKPIPVLGGVEMESGWALLGVAVLAAPFAPLAVSLPVVAAVASFEAPKVVSQIKPAWILPPQQAAQIAGGVAVGAGPDTHAAADAVRRRMREAMDAVRGTPRARAE